jgi:hypothetical protein
MLAACPGQSQKETQIAKNIGGTNATTCKLLRPAVQCACDAWIWVIWKIQFAFSDTGIPATARKPKIHALAIRKPDQAAASLFMDISSPTFSRLVGAFWMTAGDAPSADGEPAAPLRLAQDPRRS